jgi:hypothetical protein
MVVLGSKTFYRPTSTAQQKGLHFTIWLKFPNCHFVNLAIFNFPYQAETHLSGAQRDWGSQGF